LGNVLASFLRPRNEDAHGAPMVAFWHRDSTAGS
jgi:hypothetical protein